MVGEHGTGMTHLAWRADNGAQMKDMSYRFGGQLTNVLPKRIGIEKHGDQIAIFLSMTGEPMHQFGPPITMHFDGPFYVGIGFCSHLPATVDTGMASNVSLENSAGKVTGRCPVIAGHPRRERLRGGCPHPSFYPSRGIASARYSYRPACVFAFFRKTVAEISVISSPTGNGSINVIAALINGLAYIAFACRISLALAASAAALAPAARAFSST